MCIVMGNRTVDNLSYLQSPGVLAIGSSMKGQNSYSHHLILMLVSQLWIGSRFIP
ncbi:hypothetical protein HanPI659440_Chr12g0459251 [Helianthus annuus]|nr:hypothetical protein HanPI659440_Chr12g0459251 [Helianthus annuus]